MTFDLREQTLEISGKVGVEWVYQKNGRRRAYVVPTNPQTEAQQAWRYKFGDVQKEMVASSSIVQGYLRDLFGYTWHARAIGLALADDGALWDFYAVEFLSFSFGDQEAWSWCDMLPNLVNLGGMVFYIVSSVIYAFLSERVEGISLTLPESDNSAIIGKEWDRMSWLTDSVVLGASVVLNLADGVYQDIVLRYTAPVAGLFRFDYDVRAYVKKNGVGGSMIVVALYDYDAAAIIAGTQRQIVWGPMTTVDYVDLGHGQADLDLEEGQQIGLWAYRLRISGGTWVQSQIVSDANGSTVLAVESVFS